MPPPIRRYCFLLTLAAFTDGPPVGSDGFFDGDQTSRDEFGRAVLEGATSLQTTVALYYIVQVFHLALPIPVSERRDIPTCPGCFATWIMQHAVAAPAMGDA